LLHGWLLRQPILDEEKDIEETLDCNCFDNMMDTKYEKVNPVDAAKSQKWVSSISL
jgi:hypothetical protein